MKGEFAYSSDLWLDDALFGVTLRSPYPRARITKIDLTGAVATPDVYAVLTHEDVPGSKYYGLDDADQPVLAIDEVRYQGEPVVILAAADPHTARRALEKIVVEYEELPPLTDARTAVFDPAAIEVHPEGNVVRHQPIRHGDPDSATAEVVVVGEYEVGMQDQAFLGPESGLAVPAADGGVDLFVATQWLHTDREQIAPCLGLPEEKVRLTLAGVGGAFGAREDLSMQVHACLLALHTGRPVRMVYGREESFFGHVHRHPAWMRYEHGADRSGNLVYVKATIVLDGGAYASTTKAVVGNAASLGAGPYEVPHVAIDAYGARTNNPPCGAMRGFGAVQACFGYESQMDALAAKLGLDPVEFRARNAVSQGSVLPTGQVIDSPAPLAEMLHRLNAMPMPADPPTTVDARRRRTRRSTRWLRQHHPRRGCAPGCGLRRGDQEHLLLRGLRRLCDREGAAAGRGGRTGGDRAHGRGRGRAGSGHAAGPGRPHRARRGAGDGRAGGHERRVGRFVVGVAPVVHDRRRGEAGLRGGAFPNRRPRRAPAHEVRLEGGKVVSVTSGVLADLVDVLGDDVVEETAVYRHRPTRAAGSV